MVISPYDTEPNYLFWQGDQNLIYFMKFDISFRNKWHSVDHGGGAVYALWSSSNHPYTSKECYNTLKQ